jgi:acetyltransferase
VIHAIPRYPVYLIDVVQVGGRRVTVRPALRQDTDLQADFFRRLSPESRYSRFLTPVNEVPAALLARFADIDRRRHLALVATAVEGTRERMVGEARYAAHVSEPGACELAIAVGDAWRGSGLAWVLLERLERLAARAGFRRMIADTLISNGPMLGLGRRAGYEVTASPDDPTLARLQKCLVPEPAPAIAA